MRQNHQLIQTHSVLSHTLIRIFVEELCCFCSITMVNGPPTPPPTSAAELQDEAREQQSPHQSSDGPPASASNSSAHTSQTRQDSYQFIFPSISDLASENKFHQLTLKAEKADLSVRLDLASPAPLTSNQKFRGTMTVNRVGCWL